LPTVGPSASAISSDAKGTQLADGYVFLSLTSDMAKTLAQFQPASFSSRFGSVRPPPVQRLGVGDVLSVTLFEAGQGSLFPSQNGARVTFTMTVGSSGDISIPYAGSIRARGRTPRQLEHAIVAALTGKAVQPQAVVVVTKPISSTVVVGGDVKRPGRQPISPAGTRILDAVADAGGAVGKSFDTRIKLVRHGHSGEVMMQDLVDRPHDNVYVHPGDELFLVHQPQVLLAFGAVSKPGEVPFSVQRMSLLDALAKTGGLSAIRAEGAVFLFRFEPKHVADALAPNQAARFGARVPTVFTLDMRDPNAFFIAKSVQVHDRDVLYVSTSPSVDLQNFLTLINSGVSSAYFVGTTATAF
jgi:polysaccharide export outer membrane protein